MHCGERLRDLIRKANYSQEDFSELISTPYSTLTGWLNDYDIRLSNIRKCCKALNIPLHEFFLPEDTPVPDYVSLGIDEKTAEIIQLYKSLPKEKRIFLLEVMKTAIKELIAMGEKK